MAEIDIIIPVEINDTYQIKSNIDSGWVFSDIIYSVTNVISVVCRDNNCNYVGKRLPVRSKYDTSDCPRVRNELIMSKYLSEVDIGPMVYDISMNEKEAVIIMDRYDGTLADLMALYQTDRSIPVKQILDLAYSLLQKMHSLNIYHGDIHMGNILYTKDGKVALTDFSRSLYTTSPELKDDDYRHFEGIKEVYNRINQGEIFVVDEDFPLISFEFLRPSPYNFTFVWNNKICYWD